jgi:transcriptional regulator with XRE-family HTH domain
MGQTPRVARYVSDEERARWVRAGQWLYRQRKQRGWTQTEFGTALGLASPRTAQDRVSAMELGQTQITAEVAGKIADALGIPEIEVWRGLELPLPREYDSPALRTVERLLRTGTIADDVIAAALQAVADEAAKRPGSGRRRKNTTQGGESSATGS